MKFSVNWLREFVDLPRNPEEIADLLTRAGVETKNIETRSAKIDKVIVSQITASSRHPNADRLTVCEVDDGSGTKRQVVCGATNYKVGDKVPLALPGTKLPNGVEIRKSKLRGVESEGMLCSPIELGLGEDASGLLILSPDAKIGAPIGDLFPADTILDVEITPNRGDLLSHFGLAREIAALTDKKLKSVAREAKIDVKTSGVTISARHECPFFSGREIDNVKVGTESAMVARQNRERRHSLDQQHRRHLQFCDARAWSADARIRRRQIERRHRRAARSRRRKISRARWQDLFAEAGQPCRC